VKYNPRLWSDESLMELVARGDMDAFDALFRRWNRRLVRWLLNRKGLGIVDKAAAEDIVQETFLRVLKGARGFNPRRTFSNWLLTIARNEAERHLGKAKRHRVASLNQPNGHGEEGVELIDLLRDPRESLDEELIRRKLIAMVRWAMSILPHQQRMVVEMKVYEGMTFRQIASALQIPMNTVLSRMRYAKDKLQRFFSAEPMRLLIHYYYLAESAGGTQLSWSGGMSSGLRQG